MYSIKSVSPVKKDLKKIPVQVKDLIQNKCFPEIKSNPYEADNLHGEFSKLKSYHLKHSGIDYRIIYQIYEDEKIIRVLMIGSRENIYKKLKLRLD